MRNKLVRISVLLVLFSPVTSALSNALVPLITQTAQSYFNLYNTALAIKPLQTKVLTGTFLAFAGDFTAQKASLSNNRSGKKASRFYKKESNNDKRVESSDVAVCGVVGKTGYDVKRTVAFGLFGGVYLSFLYFWFPFLLKVFRSCAIKCTLVHQMIAVPLIYYPLFYFITGLMRGHSLNKIWEGAKSQYKKTLLKNYFFWLPAQYVQFAFVNIDHHILYCSALGFVWNIILSAMSLNQPASARMQVAV